MLFCTLKRGFFRENLSKKASFLRILDPHKNPFSTSHTLGVMFCCLMKTLAEEREGGKQREVHFGLVSSTHNSTPPKQKISFSRSGSLTQDTVMMAIPGEAFSNKFLLLLLLCPLPLTFLTNALKFQQKRGFCRSEYQHDKQGTQSVCECAQVVFCALAL